MRVRKDGKVCLPPMWWISASAIFLRAVQFTLLLPPLFWLLGKWSLKEAAIALALAIALQWIALIALKLVEETFFVQDLRDFPEENELKKR